MKINRILLMLLAGSMFVSACSDSFLEDPEPTTSVSPEQVFQSIGGARAALNGIYSFMRTGNVDGNTDDYGLLTVRIMADLKGLDAALVAPSWYYWDYRFMETMRTVNSTRTREIWSRYYKMINDANTIITFTPGIDAVEEEKNQILGEALGIRAYLYFELAKLYQHTYAKDAKAPAVPIYLEPSTAATKGNPRASLTEVYTQIVKDLLDAASKVGKDRGLKSNFNIDVINGLLARVYLNMENWTEASKYAKLARKDYPLMSGDDFKAGFNDTGNAEWIWGLPTNGEQTLSWAAYFSFWDHNRASGYMNIYCDKAFKELFTATDARNLFEYDDVQETWYSTKMTDKPDNTGAIVMMRAAEMYLIEAEAEAEAGNNTAAQDALFEVQGNRDADAVKSAATGATLVNEILLERRKELFGEGFAFFDIKRRQLALKRGADHWYQADLPANAKEFVLQIPKKELDSNSNINEEDQNP
ncbi:RagB/SusD family nutrient uptake outer membrane protein [Marinifilum fragile]|uniref:RagB/SusD family nutrient uptake outer membrane protein n=1 Tax=Marinifilum fragile TaxID=570161 RepID=UPI002AA89145|nr:RagB/SusD family nutrient uptake outer membrane protein [Marinifilum fragile]